MCLIVSHLHGHLVRSVGVVCEDAVRVGKELAFHAGGRYGLVGAINVLERGYRLSACGEMALLSHSMKQEPSEAAQVAYA